MNQNQPTRLNCYTTGTRVETAFLVWRHEGLFLQDIPLLVLLFIFSLSTFEVWKDWPRITVILAGGYQTSNTGESVLQSISLCSCYSRIPVSFLLSTILLVTYPLFGSSKPLTLCIFSWLRFTYCAHTPSSSRFWHALITIHFYLAILFSSRSTVGTLWMGCNARASTKHYGGHWTGRTLHLSRAERHCGLVDSLCSSWSSVDMLCGRSN